jgi:hypothetical protein
METYGGLGIPRCLGRLRASRAVFVLAALVLGGAALLGAPGAAAGPAVSTTTPVTYDGTNTCTGDMFTGTGNIHTVFSENASASGVLQHHLDMRIDGLQAVTTFPVPGKKYVVQDTYDEEFVFGSAAEETFDITLHFIRVGEDGTLILGDDFYEYLRTHITANANGDVTAFSVRTNDMPCQ